VIVGGEFLPAASVREFVSGVYNEERFLP
jgi:hypothetical protein